jgi:hypothetical protein
MIAIACLLRLVGRLMVRPLLLTSLIALSSTVICTPARGDSLFESAESYSTFVNGTQSVGPVFSTLKIAQSISTGSSPWYTPLLIL